MTDSIGHGPSLDVVRMLQVKALSQGELTEARRLADFADYLQSRQQDAERLLKSLEP